MGEQAVNKSGTLKYNAALGLAFGFAIVCKEDGKDYVDLQDDHIPEDVMLKSAMDFMENSRVAKEMHDDAKGEVPGGVVFALPLTTELAAALDITTKRTGLIIGMRPNEAARKKFENGEYKGFSIGGFVVE